MERYRVEKVVGEGSFGKAILCARVTDGKACVVKQVDTTKLPSKARREASKEATLLAKLSHPNIVGFWESFFHGQSGDILCIVMDYADGGDLSSCLRRRNGRLLEEEVILDWFVQTTLALKHIHDRRILHRDLKTQNIFLTRSRVVKLGDFGIAKVLASTVDLARTAVGTPYYMSPEICQEKRYNHKSDMWSLGCVLYEMACLRHAFEGSNMRLLVMKICAQEPRPMSARYSSGMRTLLSQLLKKDPHARPSTGAVLRRPLIKEKIGRFLDETQIRKEFSNGVPPNSPAGAPAAGGLALPSPPGNIARGWPFNVRGRGGQRADPSGGANGNQGADPPVAVGDGEKVPRAAAAGRAKQLAAEEDAKRREDALAKRKEIRAMAKERGRRAANALKAAKLPARDDAWDEERRQRAHAVRQARGGRLEAGRLREQAELARIAFGIEKMSPRRPSPREIGGAQAVGASPGEGRRRARTPGSPRADMPRGIASPRPRSPAPAVAPGACGERPSERVFQRGQNLRLGSPDVAGGAAQPNKPEKVGRQERAEGVVDVKVEAEQSDAAQDLARRRRAARAVFGPGFGVHDTYDPPARPGSAKEAVSEHVAPEAIPPPDEPSSKAERMPDVEGAVDDCRGSSAEAEGREGICVSAVADEKETSGRGRDNRVDSGAAVVDNSHIVDRKEDVPDDEHGDLVAEARRSPVLSESGGNTGGDDVNSSPINLRVDLRLEDGWFDKLEARMGAIKKQVGQIQSPRFATPHRGVQSPRGAARDAAGAGSCETPLADQRKHDYREPNGKGEGMNWPIGQDRSTLERATPDDREAPSSEAAQDGGEAEGRNFEPSDKEDQPAAAAALGGNKTSGSVDGFRRLRHQTDESASAAASSRRRGDGFSPPQSKKVSAAAAAIENAAAAVAAIPRAEKGVLPIRRQCNGGDIPVDEEESGAKNDKGAPQQGIRKSPRSDAQASKPIGASSLEVAEVKVITTPAQRQRGGRVLRKPLTSSRSERKPPRYAAALAAELERRSERRPSRKPGKGVRTPGGGEESNIKTPTAEERVQALRANHDRDRAKLRALIAQKRKASSGTGGTASAGVGIDAPEKAAGGPDEAKGCSTPSRRAAGDPSLAWPTQPDTKAAASEPPLRRNFRSPIGAGPRRGTGMRCPGGGSLDAPRRRRRRPRSNDEKRNLDAEAQGQEKSAAEAASRDPVKRQENLRAFIAKGRRERRAREGPSDDNISVWTRPGAGVDHDEASVGAVSPPHPDHGEFVVGTRRNIGLEFDQEDEAWCGAGCADVGESKVRDDESEAQEKDENFDRSGEGESSSPPAGTVPLPRKRSQSEDILAELSTLEKSVVAELHEVVGEKAEAKEEREFIVREAGGGLLGKVTGGEFCVRDGGGGSGEDEKEMPQGSVRAQSTVRADSAADGDAGGHLPAEMDPDSHISESSHGGSEGDTSDNVAEKDAREKVGGMAGLATYDSEQAAAVGMVGGVKGAGEDEYAQMLAQMQQEVQQLGDGVSTDSSWEGSSSEEARHAGEPQPKDERRNENLPPIDGSDSSGRSTQEAKGAGRRNENGPSGKQSGGREEGDAPAQRRGPKPEAKLAHCFPATGKSEADVAPVNRLLDNDAGDGKMQQIEAAPSTEVTADSVDVVREAEEAPSAQGKGDVARNVLPGGSLDSDLEYSKSGQVGWRQPDGQVRAAERFRGGSLSEGVAAGDKQSAPGEGGHANPTARSVVGSTAVEDEGTRSGDPLGVGLVSSAGSNDPGLCEKKGKGPSTPSGWLTPDAEAGRTSTQESFATALESADREVCASRANANKAAASGATNEPPSRSEEAADSDWLIHGEPNGRLLDQSRTRFSWSGETLSGEEEKVLRNDLREKLGSERFLDACRYLRDVDVNKDDDEMTLELEHILGGAEDLELLPDLLRLLAAEERSSDRPEDDRGLLAVSQRKAPEGLGGVAKVLL